MKRAVSISLGSSQRDKTVQVELLGESVLIDRRGVDGDVDKATELFSQLDGQVHALGVGGIDLWIQMGERRYNIRAAQKMVRHVKHTPLVDGSGLKNTLERQVVQAMIDELGPDYGHGRAILTAAADRYGMALAFFEHDYEVACCDLMFSIGVPIAVRSLSGLNLLARLLAPIIARLPISVLYPTGDKQDEIIPKFTKWYHWANVIAGDCHYIKRHMPADLSGRIIVTNTTTDNDMKLFRERGITHVVTTTPVINGRSFGTNMLEAALTAVADKGRALTFDELNGMLLELDMHPSVHALQPASFGP